MRPFDSMRIANQTSANTSAADRAFSNAPANLVQEPTNRLCPQEGGGAFKLLVAAMFSAEWGV